MKKVKYLLVLLIFVAVSAFATKVTRMPVEITNYLLHVQPKHRYFVDLDNSIVGDYDYYCDSTDQFLRVEINNKMYDFQAETTETRQFIKNFLHIDITQKVGC